VKTFVAPQPRGTASVLEVVNSL